jgi:hypothetical protein
LPLPDPLLPLATGNGSPALLFCLVMAAMTAAVPVPSPTKGAL